MKIKSHRHVGIAMYYHGMCIVEALRDPELDPETHERYTVQLAKIRKRLSDLADHSEVNYRMYQRVVVMYKTTEYLLVVLFSSFFKNKCRKPRYLP